MSLPPALQARLAKRGIIKTNKDDSEQKKEEVIAESYDEPSNEIDPSEELNCPNRSNPYHKCTKYCKDRYGLKTFNPNSIIEKRRLKMLKLYPLPQKWKEVQDLSTNRYYYWNTETDMVSWLSPTHPNAFITEPACKRKVEISSSEVLIAKPAIKSNDDIDELLDIVQNETQIKKAAKQKRGDNNPLDPMDPASYSDIPRGNWSQGLESVKDT